MLDSLGFFVLAGTLIITAIPVIYLVKDKIEKKPPELVVSLEIVRDSLVCLVLRNLGDVSLEMTSISFSETWLSKVDEIFQKKNFDSDGKPLHQGAHGLRGDEVKAISELSKTSITFLPKQQWAMPFFVNLYELPHHISLEINFAYCRLPKKRRVKLIKQSVIYITSHYGRFLLYKSDIDEIRRVLRNVNKTEINTLRDGIIKLTQEIESIKVKLHESGDGNPDE